MKKKFLCMITAIALLVGTFAGCGKKDAVAELEAVDGYPEDEYEIQWYLPIENTPSDLKSVEKELSKYLKEKINATIKINIMASGQYKEKLGMMVNTGEYFDMCFVANWMLDYTNNARKDVFFDLTDYLDTYLKDTKEAIGEDYLKPSRVNGRQKALPVFKEMATQYGWVYRKDIADKYGIDMSQYSSYEDFLTVAEMLKQKEKSIEYVVDWSNTGTPYDMICPIYGIDNYKGVFEKDKSVNVYITDAYKQAIKTARTYYEKGLVRPDVLTATDSEAKMAAGKTFAQYIPVKPGKAKEMFPDAKYDFAEVAIGTTTLDHMAGAQSMQAISATSKNPARVMKFMNLLNTDAYVKNLVIHGIEGKHYKKVSDKIIEPIKDSGYSLYTNSWMIGNVFLDYITVDEDPQKLEYLKQINEKAVRDPIQGFIPSELTGDIKQINADCTAACNKYRKQLERGAVETEPTYSEFVKALDKCEYKKLCDYYQSEYDKYSETLNK